MEINIVPSNQSDIGTHLILNCYDVPNREFLRILVKGKEILYNFLRGLGFIIINQTGHQFNGAGYSQTYILSNGHFVIHTFPEHTSCYIDFFCFNSKFDSENITLELKKVLNTIFITSTVINR
jgi:S-adenosylmethionine/arginine decarboxylase-like enzyme